MIPFEFPLLYPITFIKNSVYNPNWLFVNVNSSGCIPIRSSFFVPVNKRATATKSILLRC